MAFNFFNESHEDILFPLRNKVALVTGGSRGIGAAMCRRFSASGADIVTTYLRNPESAEAVVADVKQMGQDILLVKTDTAERAMVETMFEQAVQKYGKVDIVVANAAVNHRFPVAESPLEDARRTVEVSMWGVFHTLQLGARRLIRQGTGGRLLAISSIHAEVPFPNSGAYNMSKAGINHLCRTMALELAPHGITVNVIEPGWIDTEGERESHTEEQLIEGTKGIPLGRMGLPDEIAKLARFLVSSEADYVTGSVFRMDGGLSLRT